MILFYSKITGDIFATIGGRVHSDKQLEMSIKTSHLSDEQVGKYIIGWIEKDGQKIEYNTDKFSLLEEFESTSLINPMDYKINLETGNLEKKNAIA